MAKRSANGTVRATDAVRQARNINEPVELSTGIKVKINIAPAVVIEQAVANIPVPKVYVQELEDGRKVENPNHPDYLNELQEHSRKQFRVGMDVMIAFVDLIDGLPEDDDWIKRLRYLERLGHIDLEKYDLDDELDKEFVYKRFIAFGNDDLQMLARMSGISEEDRQLAEDSFRSPA